MALEDLASFFDDDSITIPIKGKNYTIPSPDAETGIRLAAVANLGAKAARGVEVSEDDLNKIQLSDDDERDFMRQVLGTAYDEMVAGGVSWVAMQRASQYAFAYFAMSPEAANKGVESGAFLGKAPAPNRAQRRGKAPTTGTASTGSKKTQKTS